MERTDSAAYKQVAEILESAGFVVMPIDLSWDNKTVSQNTEEFLELYYLTPAKKKYILGFSFGAMIAFIASTKVEVAGLILCSLSPYFSEDLPKIGSNWTPETVARYQDFAGLSCSQLAKQLKAKQVLMLYGKDEAKSVVKRVSDAFEKIELNNKYLVPINGAEHNIGDAKYLLRIHQVAQRLA
jgi:alpha-beta hydrolase superfamily lysophospholipase